VLSQRDVQNNSSPVAAGMLIEESYTIVDSFGVNVAGAVQRISNVTTRTDAIHSFLLISTNPLEPPILHTIQFDMNLILEQKKRGRGNNASYFLLRIITSTMMTPITPTPIIRKVVVSMEKPLVPVLLVVVVVLVDVVVVTTAGESNAV